MSKPNTKPDWIPDSNPAKITAPDSTKQADGWASAEKPPYQYFNWFWNLVSKWIAYFETITDQVPVANGGTGASTASGARTNLGFGTIATQDANNVSVSGGAISGVSMSSVSISSGAVTGITDLAVADGGTGASTAANARSNLGCGTMATQNANVVAITGGSVAGITDLAVADGGTGASNATNARSNLGLGSMATQAANAVAITGGSISDITDLAVADGGTGASNAAAALSNLGLIATAAEVNAVVHECTATAAEITAIAHTGKYGTKGVLLGSTTAGYNLGVTRLSVAGRTAGTASGISTQSIFNGVGLYSLEEVSKGGTGTNFDVGADGTYITIKNLPANTLLLGGFITNYQYIPSIINIVTWDESGTDVSVRFVTGTGAGVDISTLNDTQYFYVNLIFLYIPV